MRAAEFPVHSARNKAGRAAIAQILDYANRVTKVEIDNLTDERSEEPLESMALLRGFIEIDGKHAEVIELEPCKYVYVSSSGKRFTTKYIIHTVAIPC